MLGENLLTCSGASGNYYFSIIAMNTSLSVDNYTRLK